MTSEIGVIAPSSRVRSPQHHSDSEDKCDLQLSECIPDVSNVFIRSKVATIPRPAGGCSQMIGRTSRSP